MLPLESPCAVVRPSKGLGHGNKRVKTGVEAVQKPFVWLACSVISLLKVAYL